MSALLKLSANPDMVNRMALGALRFVDAATGQPISEGLSVIARVRNRTISAIASPRGVHVFHQLPGLGAVSFWDGEEELKPTPLPCEYNIEVRDTSRRYFSMTFKTSFFGWSDATNWSEGTPVCSAAGSPVKNVPLYSAPWRAQRGDFALIRGTLRVKPSKKPAAWALLRVYRAADDQATALPLVEGITGQDGQFLLMFPWPKADSSVLNGPKGLNWSVRIQARYDLPGSQIPPEEYHDGEKKLLDLCSILEQKPATLLAKYGNNDELPPQQMIPGKTLFLETTEIPPSVTTDKKILYLYI